MAGSSIFDTMREGMKQDIDTLLEYLIPASSDFQRKQMLTENRFNEGMSLSVMGVFRRKFKSKVLEDFQDEFQINRKSLDRKGIGDLLEAYAGIKRAAQQAEKDAELQ